MISLFVVVVLSYLIGSFPTSILVSKYIKGIDIRDYGSGNAGGTNVLRTLGWKAGISVMLFDVAKGWVAAYYIAQFGYEKRIDFSPICPNPCRHLFYPGTCLHYFREIQRRKRCRYGCGYVDRHISTGAINLFFDFFACRIQHKICVSGIHNCSCHSSYFFISD